MGPERAYIAYWKLEQNNYWKKIELFEKEQFAISLLTFEDRKTIEQDYLNAIFEIGKYQKYLSKVDSFIEDSLEYNQELYVQLLSKKAAAIYNLGNIEESKSLCLQVIAIDPKSFFASEVLLQCIRKEKSPNYHYIKAIANFLLLLSAGVIATTWLFVIPFYPGAQTFAKTTGKTLLTISIVILILNEFIYYIHGKREWKKQIEQKKLNYHQKRMNSDL